MEGRPPDMEGSCKYIEWAIADRRVVLQLGVGCTANNPSPQKFVLLWNVWKHLGPGL